MLFKKIICGIKKNPANIILLTLSGVIYFANNNFLKLHTHGILNYFFICYLNDLICPLFFLSYSNILLYAVDKEIFTLCKVIFICFLCGLIWEFFAPVLKPNSTPDLFDILCYVLGGIIYLLIQKGVFKCQLKNHRG